MLRILVRRGSLIPIIASGVLGVLILSVIVVDPTSRHHWRDWLLIVDLRSSRRSAMLVELLMIHSRAGADQRKWLTIQRRWTAGVHRTSAKVASWRRVGAKGHRRSKDEACERIAIDRAVVDA